MVLMFKKMVISIVLCSVAVICGGAELDIRPRPQLINYKGKGFKITDETRIIFPEESPGYITVAVEELALVIKESSGFEPKIEIQKNLAPKRGDIVIGEYWAVRPEWEEPLPLAYVRSQAEEGYGIYTTERNLAILGNSSRGCFQGLQTMIQITRQTKKTDKGFAFPGVMISDWPAHNWRTLQLHLIHAGSPYDRGQHVYVTATPAKTMERAIRLAAYHKMTGLVVDVESGIYYERHPENFTTGMSRNKKADIKAAVDNAKLLGLKLVPKSNSSSGHDGWIIPYAFALPNTDIYMEEMLDLYDEIIEIFRPAHFHVGLDEDTFPNMDGYPLRDTPMHKKVLLNLYEYFRRQGITILVWVDGIHQLRDEQKDVPRDVIVLPWHYGGWDFTVSQAEIDKGFRILCAPWSCWHEENDQFFSLYASTIKSEKCLGMAGTFWYAVGGDDTDYRRCVVKAADAFWNPMKAGDYPHEKSYYSPEYSGIAKIKLSDIKPATLPKDEIPGLIALVTGNSKDNFACEAAREKLVSAGTALLPALIDEMAKNPQNISPWAEGTVRRIVREPLGDSAPMIQSLEKAAGTSGALRALGLEMIARANDVEFLKKLDATDEDVAFAMGVSGDKQFLPALLEVAAKDGVAQVKALMAIGRLKGLDELLSLSGSWKSFKDDAREAYARALAMNADEKAIPVLSELANDVNWHVRFRAAVGLGATQSAKAGPYIMKLLDDKEPAVFRTALYWCTDTFILAPEEYFPKLCERLNLDENEEIAGPIIHTIVMMWSPGTGQWLRGQEDRSKRIDYANLKVWKEKYFVDALTRMIEYKNARHATYAVDILLKSGADIKPETIVAGVKKFSIEDQRWFCERLRDQQPPNIVPVYKELWKIDDHLVRTFIIQALGRIKTPETFDIAYNGYNDIPETNEQLRASVVYTLAAHIVSAPENMNLDDWAKKSVPLMLALYEKTDWIDGQMNLEKALCRIAGRKAPEKLENTPEDHARRVAEWKEWWENQSK